MRVLFYGGCHAPRLHALFAQSAIGANKFSSLQNFELINAGTPFPFDELPRYDAVVYSPIRNKGEWNTDILVARCDAAGVRTLSYPWLQWNGYFPDVAHSDHPPHLWAYRQLTSMAREGASVAELRAVAADPGSLDPLRYVEQAFGALEAHEADVEISISRFIRENYRERRLFLTPDHPTLALYRFVQKQIASRLGIWLHGFARPAEPHRDAFIILPGVREALGLQFGGDSYRTAEGQQSLDLDGFLALTVALEQPVAGIESPSAG